MAAVEVVISGLLYHGKSGAGTPVTIVGIAGLSGLEVGGGPIIPPPAQQPPGVPTFPISGPPGIDFPDKPGYPPVVGGGPIYPSGDHPAHPIVIPLPPDSGLHPEHPIVIPDPTPPTQPGEPTHPIVIVPPPPAEGTKPPPPGGGWGYHPDYGWGYFPMGQSAGPK